MMAVGLGLIILFLSIVRSSLNRTLVAEKENRLRKIPVSLLIKRKDNSMEECLYYLPEIRTLPISPWYVIKDIRDRLWVSLCKNGVEKVGLLLLLSDKKITEVSVLFARSYAKKALETAELGVDKLKYTAEIWGEMDDKEIGKKELGRRIYKAGLVYKEVLLRVSGAVDIDQEKYLNIMKDLDRWNERQKEKKMD